MKILMVCLGNICRSPLAEGILRFKAKQRGLNISVDSCGTSNFHVGSSPDKRMIDIAMKNGIDISKLKARQFNHLDFKKFDIIYAMDKTNLHDVQSLARNNKEYEKVQLLLNDPSEFISLDVPDPYYGNEKDFEFVFKLLDNRMNKLVENYNE